MTFEIGLVFAILAAAVLLFVTEFVRVDVVALMVLVSLAATGLLSPEEAVSGFSNPAVITVWAVFILSGGLSRTGIAGILGRQVLRFAGNSEARLVMVIMLTSATLSAFMNNVGVAALLLPVVMDISRQTGRAPSKLLIPLAFSSLLGGLMTLIGTPPNILISAALSENNLEPFGMFDFTPVGALVVLGGIVYMSVIGRRILPSRNPVRELAGDGVDLEQVYGLRERRFVLDVPEGSPLAGKSLAESRVGSGLGLNVMGILRQGSLDLAPDPSVRFEPGDRIVVQGSQDAVNEVGVPSYLSLEPGIVRPQALVSEDVEFAEVVLTPRSRLLGKNLRDLDFRGRFKVLV
ncbi:MAG: SLC13 family permease, partial [Acidobacteriota bacterium]|nr:SLC13 family permease [Acidobacteriota bacterium]